MRRKSRYFSKNRPNNVVCARECYRTCKMDSLQLLQWLYSHLKVKPTVTRLEVMEKLMELQRRVLSTEEDSDLLSSEDVVDLLLKLRKIRCVRTNPHLEHIYEVEIKGCTVRTSLAIVLFEIEILITYKLKIKKWNENIRDKSVPTWEHVTPSQNVLQHMQVEPEREFLRMPMSQLVANLKRLTVGNKSQYFAIHEFELLVEYLFHRVVVFSHMCLPEDDMDIESYRLINTKSDVDEDVTPDFRTSFMFLAEMRYYFDTLFEKGTLWTWQQELMPPSEQQCPGERVEEIKKFVREKCQEFEREYFLEQLTEYVLDVKLNSKLLRDLYSQKFPDVSKPDSRRIIKHFLGQEAVVDYSNFRYIVDVFEEVTYAYEFAFLFYLKMILGENPMNTHKAQGCILTNPMNRLQFTYYDAQKKQCTPYGSFLQTSSYFISSGHSKLSIEERRGTI